jgi:hypothetical protein
VQDRERGERRRWREERGGGGIANSRAALWEG